MHEIFTFLGDDHFRILRNAGCDSGYVYFGDGGLWEITSGKCFVFSAMLGPTVDAIFAAVHEAFAAPRTCQSLVRRCMLLTSARKCGFFWEFTSGVVSACSACWLDSGYMYDVSSRVFLFALGTRTLFLRLLVSGSHLFDVVLEHKIRSFLGDPFWNRSRIQRYLVSQWIHVRVSSRGSGRQGC